MEETLIFRNTHEQIVTQEEFDLVQQKLRNENSTLQAVVQSREQKNSDIAHFVELVRGYEHIDKLTPEIMHELIERIEVHEVDSSGGQRKQRVNIFFPLPPCRSKHHNLRQIRQTTARSSLIGCSDSVTSLCLLKQREPPLICCTRYLARGIIPRKITMPFVFGTPRAASPTDWVRWFVRYWRADNIRPYKSETFSYKNFPRTVDFFEKMC